MGSSRCDLPERLRHLALAQIDRFAGLQMFVSRAGEVLVDEAVGRRVPDERPLETGTRMAVWSAGKPVTAMALHQMVERGLVTYGDPVSRHIAEFSGDGKQTVTVRHLLLHQAGIPDDWNRVTLSSHRDREALIDLICGLQLEYKPGSRVAYHALTASALMAEIVRRVDGRALDSYCDAEIFGPLEMRHSTWGLVPDLIPSASSQRAIADGAVLDLASDPICTAVVPGAGLWTTAADLGRFYECWRKGGAVGGRRLLSRATVALATANHVPILDFPHFGFGYGFMVGTAPEANPSRGSLCSRDTFGHPGAQCSVALCDPTHDLVVVFIVNVSLDQDESDRRLGMFCDEVYRALV